MKLNSLDIKSFRGATKPLTVGFDTSKKITMVFGENGNGKSTIADALVCLCTENLGSIQDKSSTDKSYLKSIGTGASEAKITLNTDAGIFAASLSGSSKIFTKNPVTGLPNLKFLRRSQIVSLIDSQASDRYTALKDYIDVSNISKCEDTLRITDRDLKSEYATAVKTLQEAISTLESAWEKEGKPESSMMDWAKIESEKDLTKETQSHTILVDLLNQWKAIKNKHGDIIQQESKVKELLTQKELLSTQLAVLETNTKNNASQLLKVLEEAKVFISGQQNIDKCPVCDSGIKKDVVLSSLAGQIQSMGNLQKLTKDVAAANKANENAQSVLTTSVENISKLLIKYKQSISKYADRVATIVPFVNGINTESNSNYQLYVVNLKALEDLYIRIDKSTTDKKKAIDQHSLIATQFKRINENENKALKLEKLSSAATKALGLAEATRKEFIDNELLSISSEVEQMYQKMHPNEGLGGIRLFLKPGFKNSLELNASFHTEQNIAPQSVYSESHLDTLGICIFLALAKKYSEGNTILILDDVVMSVDENHLDRFIQLLHDEVDSFAHILITTHYRPWRDRYRNNRAPSANVHFLELRHWIKENGIRIYNGKVALDELKEMLTDSAAFHRENISGTSGRILENILDFVTIKFASRVPRKPRNDYQLSELLDSLSKELLKVFKVEHLSKAEDGQYTVQRQIELKSIIDKLKQLKAVRNQVGAHYNFDGSLVSDSDVEEFGKTTLELAEALICSECGSLPDRNKSGSYWETKTGSIRLYPLSEPK